MSTTIPDITPPKTRNILRQSVSRKLRLEQTQRGLIEAEKALAPDVVGVDHEVYAFPNEEDWRMISQRDPFGAGITGEKDEDRLARQQLAAMIPEVVLPEGSTFEQLVDLLRTQGKISIDVNWNALSLVGVDLSRR